MAISERRSMMISVFVETWSLKSAVRAVSERFQVDEATLRIDWHRRGKWPKEVFEHLSAPALGEFYLMGIHKTLAQIEGELTQNKNPSCRVGLLKAKAEILFRLLEVQNRIAYEVLVKKVENLEKKLEFLESERGRQSDEVS